MGRQEKTPSKQILTEQQERFCREYVTNGGHGTKAAIYAGYKNPEVMSHQLKKRGYIQLEIGRLQREFINGDLATLALQTVSDLMTSPKTPANVKLGAAKAAMAAAGLDKKEQEKQLENKDLADMDLSELNEFIKAGSRRLANLRKPIDVIDVEPEASD